MEYFLKINGNDYSMYVNQLIVTTQHTFETKTTATGKDRISYRYPRRIIDVGIIPLNDATMVKLLNDLDSFRVSVSFRNPKTNTLIENLDCIIPQNTVEYYTIQAGNVSYKAFTVRLQEVNYIGEVI